MTLRWSIILTLCLFSSRPLQAEKTSEAPPVQKPIAVVQSHYDKIDLILKKYRIPFDLVPYRDLEKPEFYEKHRSIFFPCGMETPIEDNLLVRSKGYFVQSVEMKGDYYEIDQNKVSESIKNYIREGGAAYFSGYSVDFLQDAFNPFDYFFDFPNSGLSGHVSLKLSPTLQKFSGKDSMKVLMDHSGWIAIKSLSRGDVLATGTFDTPRGTKSGPIIAHFTRKKGEFLYSSYHTRDPENDLMRYMVFRIAYRNLLQRLMKHTAKWEQGISDSVIDAIMNREQGRTYGVDVKSGKNTLYFTAEGGRFQVDLFDESQNLIFSLDHQESEFFQDFKSSDDARYTLRVFPSTSSEYIPFAVLIADGSRFIPYLTRVFYGAIAFLVLLVVITIFRMMYPRKFSTRTKVK